MDLRLLRYFIALAEELHFSRAASRLAISQPPLSIAIKQLESELGVALFERSSKAVSLTQAGAALYPQALKVIAQLDMAWETTRDVGLGRRGRLTVGFVGGMLLRGLPELVRDYEAAHPGVSVTLREMGSAEQILALTRKQLNLGFLHTSVLPQELDSLVVGDEAFVACLPEQHVLADRPAIRVQELRDENLVLFARDMSPSYYDSVIALCASAGFSPRVHHQVSNWLTALVLVARNAGVALIPDAFMQAELRGVRYVRLMECNTRSLAYCAWKRDAQDPLEAEFLNYLRRRCAEGRPLAGSANAGTSI